MKSSLIVCEDEAHLSSRATPGDGWAESHKRPEYQSKQSKREGVTIFGAAAPETGQTVLKTARKGNTNTFRLVLIKIMASFPRDKKIILVLDNVRYHHAKALWAFLDKHKKRLELMFLPGYSPDFNPVEKVWGHMRRCVTHNWYFDSLKARRKALTEWAEPYKVPNEEMMNVCKVKYSV